MSDPANMQGATPSPAILLTYLYFLQGLPYGLQARFLPIYFRSHGMSLANIGYIKALFFPWMCKTLWAPLVDRHGNKKAWLWWSMVGLCATCFLAAGIDPSWMFALCVVLLIFNLLTSTQDIATDGLAIEVLSESQVASGNIAQVVGYKLGAVVGGGLLAWLSDRITWTTIFLLLALLYAIALVVVQACVPQTSNSYTAFTVQVPEPSKKLDSDTESKNSSHSEKQSNSVTLTSSSSTQGSVSTAERIDSCETHSDKSTPGSESLKSSAGGVTLGSSGKTRQGSGWWMLDHFADVFSAEGTPWILLYVLVYKLGEQGALNMMPMFLLDHEVAPADVGLWTGVVGQFLSIAGSVIGGAAISPHRLTALQFLRLMSVVKVGVLAVETVAITTWSRDSPFSTDACILLMLVLLVVSGSISTSAFTLMMLCSQRAPHHCRASHYSLLATAEVLGKLLFSIFVGAVTDWLGYSYAFVLFLTLSVIVLPLFLYSPPSLERSVSGKKEGCSKSC